MPTYQLSQELYFPPVSDAEEDGCIATGGDLAPERLMLAYHSGIFPWYNDDEPIMWYSPNPRFVLLPEKLYVSRSMRSVLRKEEFKVTYNEDFVGVINTCKQMQRVGQDGTWITQEMVEAYIKLHELGHAQSVEVWKDSELVGGMYGVHLGTVYCGESMFSKVSNASKVGLITFIQKFKEEGGQLYDCQAYTDHMASMGAENIDRKAFLKHLPQEL
ncbi:leucyl/phenylalanyl-tRNA--protein transferase [Ekhidna sp. To15]|uniref:leucyl/phenylalanyl-tRNA--protein transferase n=1 Tax=Ekhidna sp. To15 TaxID=3395267 RepID=UPI003F526F74